MNSGGKTNEGSKKTRGRPNDIVKRRIRFALIETLRNDKYHSGDAKLVRELLAQHPQLCSASGLERTTEHSILRDYRRTKKEIKDAERERLAVSEQAFSNVLKDLLPEEHVRLIELSLNHALRGYLTYGSNADIRFDEAVCFLSSIAAVLSGEQLNNLIDSLVPYESACVVAGLFDFLYYRKPFTLPGKSN